MLITTTCSSCNTAFKHPLVSGANVICPHCKHEIVVCDSDADALAAASEGGAADAAAATSEARHPGGFPYFTLLFTMPVSALLFCIGFALTLSEQWDGAAVGTMCGGGGLYITILTMRGRWTGRRALWMLVTLATCLLLTLNIGMSRRAMLAFKPLETEFATVTANDSAAVKPHPLTPRIFPLILHAADRHETAAIAPAIPAHFKSFRVYEQLPPDLKALTVADVHTVVLLDWNWKLAESTPKNEAAKAYAGICHIRVFDRKSHVLIAETTLESPMPAAPAPSSDFYGPQPSVEDIVAYLRSLPVETASAQTAVQ